MDFREQLQRTMGDGYTVERELGGGGMSRVFVATEQALGRKVVVKVLPPETSAQLSTERFKREILLAARLQHPHIVPLLTAGDAAGLSYFTMPFVEGESLRARLARQGELPVSDAMRILREIASALAYAHEQGVVHRDIKPDNVLLSRGSAMVTDFGVAKALSASTNAGVDSMTSVGVALGTPAYMAPEQATADPAIDSRADIYSFGVLAYELLTGQPPFVGRTPQNLFAAQVSETPELIERRRASLPPALSALVMRCLEKRPADRPQSAADVMRALDAITTTGGDAQHPKGPSAAAARAAPARRWVPVLAGALTVAAIAVLAMMLSRSRGGASAAAVSATGAARTIAVLPFENRSRDTTYDYFAEGVSDQLRSDLTGLRSLMVKGRASSLRFRGHDVDVHEAGRKLSVGAVVTGSLNRSGERLHLTAELVNVADGNALWSGTFDARVSDGAVVQDSLTRAITDALKVGLASAPHETAARGGSRGTTNVEAYDLFMRGTFAEGRSEWERAIAFLSAAAAKDPSFARAHAVLAGILALRPITGFGSADSALALARPILARAIALDSTLVETQIARALVQTVEWRFEDADATLARGIEADPGSAFAHANRSASLGHLGRESEAVAEGRRAKELDPLDLVSLGNLQYALFVTRDYRGVIGETRGIMDLDAGANVAWAYQVLGSAYLFLGMNDSAAAVLEQEMRLDPKSYGGRVFLVLAYAAAGRWKEAREQRALFERETGGNSPNFQRIVVHEAFGQLDSAMVDLERAEAAREPLFVNFWVNCDPMFDLLKRSPRFEPLMKRLGLHVCPAVGPWPVATRPPATT